MLFGHFMRLLLVNVVAGVVELFAALVAFVYHVCFFGETVPRQRIERTGKK